MRGNWLLDVGLDQWSHCSEGQTRAHKVTRGLHYDADAIMALPEPY